MIEGLDDLKREIAGEIGEGIAVGLGDELMYDCLASPEGEECLTLLVPNFVSSIVNQRSLARLLMTRVPLENEIEDLLYADGEGIHGHAYANMTAITHWSVWHHDDSQLRVEAEKMFDSMIVGMISTVLLRELELCVDGLTAAASLAGSVDGTLEEGLLLFNKKNEIAAKKLAPRAERVMWAEGLPLDRSFFIPEQEDGLYIVEASELEYDSYGPGDPPPPEAGEKVRRMWGVREIVTAAFKPSYRVLQFSHEV